ncbi:hypothetical protein OG782_07825 [Streptomyces sp. NBC_00876]|uniref:hypothetical protein n=1 Tax=Streptomyces sp. NBC_00876 TaxID=2975853 RepID=UPI00386E51DA|nr:hypothetical protein OG782_07825 [Streptomyces sp. NBC_00876]
MPAPAHNRSTRPDTAGVDVRLPWWAVALPAVAFAVLLLLIAGPGQAHAATGDPAVGRLLERIVELFTR